MSCFDGAMIIYRVKLGLECALCLVRKYWLKLSSVVAFKKHQLQTCPNTTQDN